MQLPQLQGNITCQNFFIYTACDSVYFDEFAKYLINSIKKNTKNEIHVHIFNPTEFNLNFCKTNKISFSYEYVPINLFDRSAERWKSISSDDLNYQRTINAMSKGSDTSIIERMQKTYYACARFIRLNQLLRSNQRYFAIDCDAIVRQSIPELKEDKDFYIHQITGPKARFLAGGIYSLGNESSINFLKEYANHLIKFIEEDQLYWGIDQDVLDKIVPKYKFDCLPKNLIDWDMTNSGIIWTAKGTRKSHEKFISEKLKYNF
jgi:hypothetical protein